MGPDPAGQTLSGGRGTDLTYGRMAALARAYGKKLEGLGIPRQTVLIVRQEPADQLAAFLGAEQAGWVPVLGHPDLSPEGAEELARVRQIGWIDDGTLWPGCGDAPVPAPEWCMGVLSSGSTGLPKLMFRTYGSWGISFRNRTGNSRWTGIPWALRKAA